MAPKKVKKGGKKKKKSKKDGDAKKEEKKDEEGEKKPEYDISEQIQIATLEVQLASPPRGFLGKYFSQYS